MDQGLNQIVGTANTTAAASSTTASRSRIFFIERLASEVGAGASELPQEADVVLEEHPDLGDPVAHHGDALESHAEGEAGDLLGIVAHGAEHLGVHHARPHNLVPPRALAHAPPPAPPPPP